MTGTIVCFDRQWHFPQVQLERREIGVVLMGSSSGASSSTRVAESSTGTSRKGRM